jgi:hypothetical protein
MLPVDVDLPIEFRELAMSCAEELVNRETDRGARLVKSIRFAGERARAERGQQNEAGNKLSSHRIFSHDFVFLFAANVFNSGVRDNGNLPNRLPSAKAGSLCKIFASCTPEIRASSVSKCVIARRFESFASR